MKHKSILALSALVVLTLSPAFAQTMPSAIKEGSYSLVKSSIVVNGKTEMTPYVFAAKDPNSGVMTTFIPIWYIMQVLKQNGNQVMWTRYKIPVGAGTLAVQSSTYKGGLNRLANIGDKNYNNGATISINNSTGDGISAIPNFVVKDPNSKVKTTFFGLYYAEELLNGLGFQNKWNGLNHTWTITSPKAAPVIAATSSNIQNAISQAKTNMSAGKTSVYGMLSTPTQWYNDPSVKFYDKSFPVSDLKDGFVIQKKPYTVVFTAPNLDASSTVVAKYVGKGSNSVQGSVTFWEVEGIDQSTGVVTGVSNVMQIAAVGLDKNFSVPSSVQGINFGNNAGPVMKYYNVYWATGYGLDAVPIPNWNPLVK